VKALLLVSAALAAALVGVSCASGPAGAGRAPYNLVFLRPDPARTALSVEDRRRIQAAHMANIQKLSDEGVMAAVGPMGDKTVTISGIFVLRAPSADEARRVAALDPTVVARRNTVDAHA
jgi:uncharacterized protein YciI